MPDDTDDYIEIELGDGDDEPSAADILDITLDDADGPHPLPHLRQTRLLRHHRMMTATSR
jgi:hypothetical protein